MFRNGGECPVKITQNIVILKAQDVPALRPPPSQGEQRDGP